jgi:hypothetical protein
MASMKMNFSSSRAAMASRKATRSVVRTALRDNERAEFKVAHPEAPAPVSSGPVPTTASEPLYRFAPIREAQVLSAWLHCTLTLYM